MRRLSGDALQSGQVGYGSISAGRVVDLLISTAASSRRARAAPNRTFMLDAIGQVRAFTADCSQAIRYLVRREAHYRVPDSAIPIDDPLFAEYLRCLSIETLT